MERCGTDAHGLECLPTALLATILTKLDDVASICSVASTCRTLNACVSQLFLFLEKLDLLGVSLSINLLSPLLPPNPYLRSLKVDCSRLDDSAIIHLLRPSLHELSLHNCADFSGKLLSEIGGRCKGLRSLYLGSVAEKRGRAVHTSDLEELLRGCCQLETLVLMFDISLFPCDNFSLVWASASSKLTSLEIGYISSVKVTELLIPNVLQHHHLPNQVEPSILPSIQKLSLSVDYITDNMVSTISRGLVSLTHLDLRDAPIMEPRFSIDLTNAGLQQINPYSKLRHLSLVRSQEYVFTHFKRVNDLGVLLMADRCSNVESISLGGFCRLTDTGFRAILHSCPHLYELRVFHGTQLTDLVFHDISATSLSLTHVSLRWCSLLTSSAVACLVTNLDLRVLDLRDCRSLGDEALGAIGKLPKLRALLLDGSNITDEGLLHLRSGCLASLSLRGCKRLTDKCIPAIIDGFSRRVMEDLNLSNLPNLSDNGILLLAKSRVPIIQLRLRQCPLIGDTSVVALASMQVDGDGWRGNGLRVLDLYNCGRLTQLVFRWLGKPYFPGLRCLGVSGSVNREMANALTRSRPMLNVVCSGVDLGLYQWDNSDGAAYMQEFEEVDELERWVLEWDEESDEEQMDVEDDLQVRG